MGTSKTCTKCKLEFDLSNFYKRKASLDGLCHWCKKCSDINSKKHYKDNRDRYYKNNTENKNRIKLLVCELKDKPCMDCGVKYPPYVMDFDHIRGKKSKGISTMTQSNYSIEKILLEIEKCDLVCANCHRERTFKRNKNI